MRIDPPRAPSNGVQTATDAAHQPRLNRGSTRTRGQHMNDISDGSAKGKIVVVTGATSGLGQATAIDFAKRGAKVRVVGRDNARAQETLAGVRAVGGEAEIVLGDVSTVAGAKTLAKAIIEKAPRIDVLINNAGGQFKTMTKTSD